MSRRSQQSSVDDFPLGGSKRSESEGSTSALYPGFGDSSASVSYGDVGGLQAKFDVINAHQEKLQKARENIGSLLDKGRKVRAAAAGEVESEGDGDDEQDREQEQEQEEESQELEGEAKPPSPKEGRSGRGWGRSRVVQEASPRRPQENEEFGDDGYGGVKAKSPKGKGNSLRTRVEKEQLFAKPLIQEAPKKAWEMVPLRLKLFFQLVFDCLSVSLAISAISLWTSPNVEFTDIVNNLSASPIVDIQLVPTSQSCPSNYNALTSTFLTLNNVCDCGPNDVRLSTCSSSDTGCTSVTSVSGFALPAWKYYKVCVMRHSTVTSLNRYGRCNETGWKTCSQGSPSDPICVPSSTPCPLTFFSIVNGGPLRCPTGTTPKKAFANSTDSRYLCTSTAGDLPLVDADIKLGGHCYGQTHFEPYSSQNPRSGATYGSVNLTFTPYACGSGKYDVRYSDIEIRQMGDLFSDNVATLNEVGMATAQVKYWTQNTYPVFYKFQTRPELRISSTCSISRQDVVDLGTELNTITSLQTGLAVVSVFTGLIVNLPWIVWSCTKGYKNYSKKTSIFLVKAVLVISGSLITIILISASFFTISEAQKPLQTFANENCGDEHTVGIFTSYWQELFQTFWMNCVVFGWNLILIGMELRLMIILPNTRGFKLKQFEMAPTHVEIRETQKINFNDSDEQETIPLERYYDPDSLGPIPKPRKLPTSESMEETHFPIDPRYSESHY